MDTNAAEIKSLEKCPTRSAWNGDIPTQERTIVEKKIYTMSLY